MLTSSGGNYAGGNKRRPSTCNQRAIRRSRGGENNNNGNIDSIDSILSIIIIVMRMIIHNDNAINEQYVKAVEVRKIIMTILIQLHQYCQ